MNYVDKARGALKSVLIAISLGINAKLCMYEGVIVYQRCCTEQRHWA